MDWISGIQKAVDYVEVHITEDLDYNEIAKQAYSSLSIFSVFSVSCAAILWEIISACVGSLLREMSLLPRMRRYWILQ